ncbi:hypothetical protein [Nocardia sp. NPDC049149]|uniref:hypothetical protein n=1 Tax=Nocardia sp. NPDC049149 TaxID=3364315 RepID=UPI003716F588
MFAAPITVRIAAIGVLFHAINHVLVLVLSPFSWNVGTVFHVINAPLYAALVLPLLHGRNWTRVLITFLLACQFLGRFVVWVMFPSAGVHLALIAGWVLTIVVLSLLWATTSSRRHFRKTPVPAQAQPVREPAE